MVVLGWVGSLVHNFFCSPLFGIPSFNLKIVENYDFSEIHIHVAWDVHNLPIFHVPYFRLWPVLQCVAKKSHYRDFHHTMDWQVKQWCYDTPLSSSQLSNQSVGWNLFDVGIMITMVSVALKAAKNCLLLQKFLYLYLFTYLLFLPSVSGLLLFPAIGVLTSSSRVIYI